MLAQPLAKPSAFLKMPETGHNRLVGENSGLGFWLVCAAAAHLTTLLLIGAAQPAGDPPLRLAEREEEQLVELSFVVKPLMAEPALEPPLKEPARSELAEAEALILAPPQSPVAAALSRTQEPATPESELEPKAASADSRQPSGLETVEGDPSTKALGHEADATQAERPDAGAPVVRGLAEALRGASAARRGDYGERRSERRGLGQVHGHATPDVATPWAPHADGPIRVEVFDHTADILLQVTGTAGLSLAPAAAGQGPEVSMPRIKLPLPSQTEKPHATGRTRRFERRHNQLVLSSQRLKEMPPGLIRHRGSFFIDHAGEYRFRIVSYNPALLRIDGSDVLPHRVKVRNKNQKLEIVLRPTAPWQKTATLTLDRGSHTFELLYWHLPWPHKSGTGYVYEFGLQLFVKPPGKREQPWTPVPG